MAIGRINLKSYISPSQLQHGFYNRNNELGSKMNVKDMMSEIKDANLNYLMMAKQLISSDKATAMFLLGISKEIADLLESLSNMQVVKLSSTNMMLTRFRFDDSAVLGMLTDYSKDRDQAHLHTSVLLASQSAEQIS